MEKEIKSFKLVSAKKKTVENNQPGVSANTILN